MKRYVVLHRDLDSSYSVWSDYDGLDAIEADMYNEFHGARLGEEYVILDLQGTGNAVVRTYRIERRVVCRALGAMEEAWPAGKNIKATSRPLGDGAFLVRFYDSAL